MNVLGSPSPLHPSSLSTGTLPLTVNISNNRKINTLSWPGECNSCKVAVIICKENELTVSLCVCFSDP